MTGPPPSPTAPRPSRLLDRPADALRSRGYVAGLRQAYLEGVRRYILFHHVRHPQEMGGQD